MRGCFVPPHIEARIRAHPDEAIRLRADRNRHLMALVRAKRGQSRAYEPNLGEHRLIRDAQGRETERGPVIRREDTPDVPGDPACNTVYDISGQAYRFYVQVQGRPGPDGQGGALESSVRYGDHWDNAALDGSVMIVGEGDVFLPLWSDPTVIWHEWGHLHTATTCGLIYTGQPGCANEAGSDIWAVTTEQWLRDQSVTEASWLVGAGILAPQPGWRALRDMLRKRRGPAYEQLPVLGTDPQPADLDEYEEGSDVHLGSSIVNGAYAEACLARGGKSWETIFPAWADAWARRLTPTASFAEIARATVAAAEDRSGRNSAEALAIQAGWDAMKVSLTEPPPDSPHPPSSPCETPVVELLLGLSRADDATLRKAVRHMLAAGRRVLR